MSIDEGKHRLTKYWYAHLGIRHGLFVGEQVATSRNKYAATRLLIRLILRAFVGRIPCPRQKKETALDKASDRVEAGT